MKTKKLTLCAMFVAVGVLSSNVIYIPLGAAKCFPIQHTINVLSAVFLGPAYGVLNAFCISLLRNFMGTGSLLAFPGSMIGALLAGLAYKVTKNKLAAVGGEIFGTGILGGLLAFPIAKFMLGKDVMALFYVFSFLTSTIGGSIIAYLILKSGEIMKLNQKNERK